MANVYLLYYHDLRGNNNRALRRRDIFTWIIERFDVIARRASDRKAMVGTDSLNLSKLRELLQDALIVTEAVKEVLRKNCDEAAYVVKPWRTRTVVERQENASTCSCEQVAVENEVEDIAAGIDRAIILAQDLRKSVKHDVAPRKGSSKRKSIEKNYSSAINCRKGAPRVNIVTPKVDIAKSAYSKNFNAPRTGEMTVSIRSTTDKPQSKSSAICRAAAKSRKGRDFIKENKLNVKRLTLLNKTAAETLNTSEILKKSPSPKASAAELSSLIHKMTQRFTGSMLISPRDGNNKYDCPLHKDNTSQVRETVIDVTEALQHFKIPSEVVAALRAYHAFLKIDASYLNDAKQDKSKKSIDIFLNEFEATNATVQNHSPQVSHLINAATESISLFADIFSGNFDSTPLDEVSSSIAESKAVLKRNNIDNIIETIVQRPSCELSLTKGWMSTGVWNISCMEHFRSFSNVFNIRYNSERQLLSLYESIQKLQHTKYLNKIIWIILRDVMPAIKATAEPTSAEFARAYKTMFILFQGLNPEVPVLVRTDS